MKKLPIFVCLLVLVSFQLACTLSASVATPIPIPLPPTATATSLPPTETSVPGTPVTVSQISILDAQNGWGWLANADYTYRLLRTTDGGQTWRDVSQQVTNFNPSGSFFLDAQTAWVSTFDQSKSTGQLWRTTDGGQHWSLVNQDALVQAFYTFDDPQHGRALTADVGAGQAYYSLYTTSDGGATWPQLIVTPPAGVDSPQPGVLHLCNICGDILYFDASRMVITHGDLASEPGGAVRFSLSTDQGQTWKDFSLTLPSEYQDGLVAPGAPKFFGASAGVLPVSISKFNADGSQAYAVMALYFTQDNGQTWSSAPAVVEPANAFAEPVILSLNDVFVLCGQKLCATQDGAQTWQALDLPAAPDNGLKLDFVSPQTGWLVAFGAETSTLFQTTDGGATWHQLNPQLLP